jgi:peptide/nickel transport system permease protein
MVSLGVLGVVLLLALFAPLIAPFPPQAQNLQTRFVPPLTTDAEGTFRIAGTDHLGRDMWSRLLYASRISLTTALVATMIASSIGIVLGLLAGFYGGWVDNLISRFLELIATFPLLLLLLILAQILVRADETIPLPPFIVNTISWLLVLSPREATQVAMVILVLAILGWTTTARLMRGMVLSVREQQYIEAGRALGASNNRLIWRHVFPNALPPLIVDFTLAVNITLVAESALSFLGFGIQEPIPTWGNMLSLAQAYMFQHPWMPIVPSLPILICSVAINYVGDGLRDALDPRQRV